MRKCRSGFTLVELLIVMGIIVLVVTMAVPSIRVLTGTRSISVAQNQLAAVLARAREDAIALQDVRGVLFYIDNTSGRVGAAIVQAAVMTDTTNVRFNTVLLDTLPGNDSLMLPMGVGLQTIYNGMDPTNASDNTAATWHKAAAALAKLSDPSGGGAPTHDRYLGFTPLIGAPTFHGSGIPSFVGGCILFDGNGRLIVRPYGFQMSTFTSSGAAGPSNLCKLLGFDVKDDPLAHTTTPTLGKYNATYKNPIDGSGSIVFMPGCPSPSGAWNGNYPAVPLVSQVGLVLFDHDAFRGLGFTDIDYDLDGTLSSYTSPWPTGPKGGDGIHSESDEESWIDVHSTPITVNRYNGTLIRGE